jgi:ADP-ribosyl-[dinitrogen reductase] hydrolase
MALCLASSLVELGQFDPADQMRRYCQWYEKGYLSSTGRCFDIGLTVRASLARFQQSGDPFSGRTDPHSAGNGCIMRLAPVPMFFHPDAEEAVRWAGESARTTHGAPECIESCQLLASMICSALSGGSKEEVLFGHKPSRFQSPKFVRLPRATIATSPPRRFQGQATSYTVLKHRLGACGKQTRFARPCSLPSI